MGIDTILWIHKDDLKELPISEATRLYELFSGRWQYCMTDRFVLEESPNHISMEDLKKEVMYNSDVSQKARDILRRFEHLRLIFQMDCETKEFDGYIDLGWFLNNALKEAQKGIITSSPLHSNTEESK